MNDNILKINGIANWVANFFQKEQLFDTSLWAKFVDVFRSQPDSENYGWRGEFWGKMMRGGSLIYSYTRDEELYTILTDSVKDMMSTAESDGRVSTYIRETEFDAWDIWCRKYVMLGCEYYLDICKDDLLKKDIIKFITGCADYIIAHIGDKEGQKRITDATRAWLGLNSSSVLEPMVKLYKLTDDKRYLDFSTYIIKEGGARGINIFKLAYENNIYPYQYGVPKAYEMISCFEGLLEYYYATGNEKCKEAVINFANAIIETEISIVGSSGITHELFDYTKVRQTVSQECVSQETCVTVTWMKFCSRVLELTGDAKFADCMEHSFYNAYLGSLNTQRKIIPHIRRRFSEQFGINNVVDTYLPVDSYSPLLSGKRGVEVGGNQLLSDLTYYGCCASIASAGVGVFINSMIVSDNNEITINFFEKGSTEVFCKGQKIFIEIDTKYPIDGNIRVHIKTDKPVTFDVKIRVPAWTGCDEGYKIYRKEWNDDAIDINYKMDLITQFPELWSEAVIYTDTQNVKPENIITSPITVRHNSDDDNYVAIFRGPITLAVDSKSGKAADSVFDFEPIGEFYEDREIMDGVPCLLKMKFTDKNGEDFYLVDYASAGKDWDSEIAVWLRNH